jgi:SOS response regulatory protein OraA/RecX
VPAKTDVIDYALRYIYRYPKTEKELIIQLRKKKYTE